MEAVKGIKASIGHYFLFMHQFTELIGKEVLCRRETLVQHYIRCCFAIVYENLQNTLFVYFVTRYLF